MQSAAQIKTMRDLEKSAPHDSLHFINSDQTIFTCTCNNNHNHIHHQWYVTKSTPHEERMPNWHPNKMSHSTLIKLPWKLKMEKSLSLSPLSLSQLMFPPTSTPHECTPPPPPQKKKKIPHYLTFNYQISDYTPWIFRVVLISICVNWGQGQGCLSRNIVKCHAVALCGWIKKKKLNMKYSLP